MFKLQGVMHLTSLFKLHGSRLSVQASRLTPRPRPHASASSLGLGLDLKPQPQASASTSRLTPRPRPHASLFKLHGSRLSVQASHLGLTPHPSASRLGLTLHTSHFFQRQTLKPYSFFNASQLSRLKHHRFTGKVSNLFLLVIGSVMSKNLVDAPLPSVEESIIGPLLLDHEMDSTQGDPIEIDDDDEDTDEGIPDKKRKKKSQVWLEFKEIEVGDGTKKAKCMHCKQRLKYAGTTSQLKRHLDNTCTRRKIALRSQRMLNMVPVAPDIFKDSSYGSGRLAAAAVAAVATATATATAVAVAVAMAVAMAQWQWQTGLPLPMAMAKANWQWQWQTGLPLP
ncbi:Zinc finger BED domain-containing protein DAYSLEEPER [Quillaja saponaria]|uniref:Zinc finger BED domain-containing protein DAYSLEEPER n=1 Tax=Quillaja saponaria TaxID=32244 RepID=A0AAD7PIZ8_QUISA|nr:Zinc finger BED domain-containing protein DAYSLEEPER [Quillaja saponaria]